MAPGGTPPPLVSFGERERSYPLETKGGEASERTSLAGPPILDEAAAASHGAAVALQRRLPHPTSWLAAANHQRHGPSASPARCVASWPACHTRGLPARGAPTAEHATAAGQSAKRAPCRTAGIVRIQPVGALAALVPRQFRRGGDAGGRCRPSPAECRAGLQPGTAR